MYIELLRDVIFIIIILSIFSYLFNKKKSFTQGNRTIRLVVYIVGDLFFISFLISIYLLYLNKGIKNITDAVIPIAMLFMSILFLSAAFFKKDFSSLFKDIYISKEDINKRKKTDIIVWILGILMILCAGIALSTYNLLFFILFLVFSLSIVIIKIKRGYW